MPICGVENCNNTSDNGFQLFNFPKNPVQKAFWLEKCPRLRGRLTRDTQICEGHFKKAHQALNQDGKLSLTDNAVPCLVSRSQLKALKIEFIKTTLTQEELKHYQACKVNLEFPGTNSPQKKPITYKIVKKVSNIQSKVDATKANTELNSSNVVTPKRGRGRPRKTPRPEDLDSSKSSTYPRAHFQSSFEEYIKPRIKDKDSSFKTKKFENEISYTEILREKNVRSYKNGARTFAVDKKNFQTYFWLDVPKPRPLEQRKLGYNFENLVTEARVMKLPCSDWKIKIMVHKREMVSLIFTNKIEPERCVSIIAENSHCELSIDNKKAVLLGSPLTIECIKDLEILLDILNDFSQIESIIKYI